MNKSDIRKQVLENRKALSCESVSEKSRIICDKLISLFPDKELCVLAYSPIKNEVDTDSIVSYYKEVYLPVTDKEEISFFRYNGKLTSGRFGVGEPERTVPLEKEPDLIIVPGVGFDKFKNRVGYGKGYYDRFLKMFPDVPKIALAYSFQIFEQIDDSYENDIKMDRIITDEDDVL